MNLKSMIITHNIPWDKCLSKQLFPAIEKGWTDSDKPIHFFWGLAGVNQKEISKCMDNNEEWWYVDVGYLTQQITRYPEPKIHDYDKTYFRICKGNLHTNRFKASHGRRLGMLEYQGIDVEFKGWKTGETKHILLCPSSPTVTFNINGITQDQWVEQVTNELKEYTDMPIKFRNKPRPNNKWWNIDIKDDLKDCHCLVTNMSLSAIDAILNMTPAITHQRNISALVTSRDLKFIKKPFKPGRKTVNEWLKMVADNQFTLEEIGNGTAYRTLREQNV